MKRIGKIAAATLVMVFLLLVVKNEYAWRLGSSTYGIPAAISMEKIDHLFIGSSMFRQGLDIHTLEEQLDGNVYILSYNGNQPAFMAKELEYLLDHGVTIENLYIDLYAFTACAAPWISDTKMFMDTDLEFKLDICQLLAKYNDVDISTYYEIFVTANNEQLLTFPINQKLVSSQFHNGGTLIHSAGQTKEHLDSLDLGVREGLHESQAEGYQKIIKLAQENNMSLLFVETPKYTKMYTDEREGAYPQLYRMCAELVKEAGAKTYLAEETAFDFTEAAYFQDLIHLSSEGRVLYSQMLCDYLKKDNPSF